MLNTINKNLKAKIIAFITLLFWSSSFLATKLVLKTLDSMTLAILRYTIAAIILIILAVVKKFKFPEIKDLPLIVLSGLSGFSLYMICFNLGVSSLTSATASVIIACSPILTSILSSIFLNEKVSKKAWAFIFVSFIGILILTLWEGVFSLNFGVVWMFLSALLTAIYNITQKKLLQKFTAMEATSYSMIAGGIVLLIYSPKTITKFLTIDLKTFLIVFYIAFFVGIVGYMLWTKALELADTTGEVANFIFLNPLFATILGIIFLNEKITIPTLVGGALILIGIIGYNKNK